GRSWIVLAGAILLLGGAAPLAQALPDGRAYELVSPVQKNGGGIVSDSQRTRAAADGDAVGFVALAAVGDVRGTGVGTDYVSVRTAGGWVTHAITPLQSGTLYDGLVGGL